jgi:hypothetical protein
MSADLRGWLVVRLQGISSLAGCAVGHPNAPSPLIADNLLTGLRTISDEASSMELTR